MQVKVLSVQVTTRAPPWPLSIEKCPQCLELVFVLHISDSRLVLQLLVLGVWVECEVSSV